MANRYPLVIDTTPGNNFAELPEGDNLLLTNSSIVNALNISAVGNIAAQTLEVDGVSVTGSYNDLTDTPDIPDSLLDLGITDGDSGFILQANGDGTFQFVSRQAVNVGNFVFTDNVMTVASGETEIRSPSNIALYPTDNIWISPGTKLIFEGTAPDDFEAKLQATTVTADRDVIIPDEDGTLATREWVNSQNFGTVIVDWTNIQGTPTTLAGYGITDSATDAQGALADTAVQPGDNLSDLTNDAGYIDSTALVGLASETYVDNAVAGLVDTAPAALDTLNELAAALGDDPNFATTISNAVGLKANSADLATVATTGAYSDLTGTPTLATIATTGAYSDLTGAPSIPATLTDLGISDGSNGDVLSTDGSGNFVFTSIDTSGGLQNIFSSISTDSGSVTATSANTIVTLAGGTDISTSAVGSTITIAFTGTIPTDVSDLTDTTNVIPTDVSGLTDTTNVIPVDISDLTDTTNVIPTALTDLGIADSLSSGDVLTTDGEGNFSFQAPAGGGGGATTLGGLTDVTVGTPNDGDGIFYNSTSGDWEASAPSGGGGSSDLAGLLDTFVDKPSEGDILVWDNANSYWANQTPTSGPGLVSRQTFQVTTSSLLDQSSANVAIPLTFPGYILYKIETDAAAWVRLYTDSTLRGVDSLRAIDEDPINVSGLISEVITVGAQTVKIAPGVIGFNDESPVTNDIPINVTNLSGSTRTITVTVTVVQIEA